MLHTRRRKKLITFLYDTTEIEHRYGPIAIGISEKSLDKEIGIMVLKLLLGLATKLFFIR